ncbi:MAG TPA: FAD-binding oxidoreductase [Thermomicrobiales bacterium]|nr:FAD-binding oxidoreductase [Thermomicrobiales bacterium]
MVVERASRPGRQLDEAAVAALAAAVRGELIRPGDAGYDAARAVYNAMIDRHPALIVRCADVADVIAAVNFAREQNLLLAVRGGGHNGPGLGVCDDGVVIDLAPMHGIRVDPAARTARVEGGCTLGGVHHATYPFGLALPSGIISTTGVGGITLGGGVGHLTRAGGLSIDNLLAVDVVLADGAFVTASADEHPDLFWAVRGGGGNFGVVTSFLFHLQPVADVYAGPMLWEMDQAADVLLWYRDFITAAPDALGGFFAFLRVPPAAPFPEPLWDRTMCGIVWCFTGPPEEAAATFAPIRARFGPPALDWVGPMPHPALQSMFDPIYPPGHQWYWKADFFDALPDEAIARHVEFGEALPTTLSTMHLYPIDGAAGRVAPDATPWSYRSAKWAEVMVGVSPDPADNARMIAWARDYWAALHPYSAGGAYVNMMMDEADEGADRVRASYRENYDRLAAIKARYDPANLFRVNQNIRPAARANGA